MREADAEIIALRQSIERLTAQVERLANTLESGTQWAANQHSAQLREMLDRPDVEQEDRNTSGDHPDDEDDAARV